MKKSMKSIFSVILALVMIVSTATVFTADVFAEGQETAAGYYYDYQQLTVGTHTLTPQATGVTLYDFSATETGQYVFTLSDENAFVGYYGSNEWFPSARGTLSYTLTFDHAEVNQPVLIGVSGTTSVTITITRAGEADDSGQIRTEVYENTVEPEEFVLPEGIVPEDFEYVDIDDSVEDKAVLGEDGYYHLNTADGPILFVGYDDAIVSFIAMFGYGQLKAAVYEGDRPVKVVNFMDAFLEYVEAAGGEYDFENFTFVSIGEGFYPLTEDFITMYKMIGKAQGWYVEDGVVGGTLPNGDAWMFACAYDEDFTTFEADDNNNNDNGPVIAPGTGDINVLVSYGIFFVAAAALLVFRKKGR